MDGLGVLSKAECLLAHPLDLPDPLEHHRALSHPSSARIYTYRDAGVRIRDPGNSAVVTRPGSALRVWGSWLNHPLSSMSPHPSRAGSHPRGDVQHGLTYSKTGSAPWEVRVEACGSRQRFCGAGPQEAAAWLSRLPSSFDLHLLSSHPRHVCGHSLSVPLSVSCLPALKISATIIACRSKKLLCV